VATFLFLHGWQGSEPGHWQRLTAAELERRGHTVRFPDFPDPDHPQLEPWLALLEEELTAVDPAATTVLAHSLGCCFWLHHARRAEAAVDRVLLVAPPAADVCAEVPELSVVPFPPLDAGSVVRSAGTTELVYAADDPYWPNGDAGALGAELGIPARAIPDGGHVNVASGFGEWPELLAWCERSAGF
jgi:predicted alpha/beta hydrolase family esterase